MSNSTSNIVTFRPRSERAVQAENDTPHPHGPVHGKFSFLEHALSSHNDIDAALLMIGHGMCTSFLNFGHGQGSPREPEPLKSSGATVRKVRRRAGNAPCCTISAEAIAFMVEQGWMTQGRRIAHVTEAGRQAAARHIRDATQS